MKCIYINIQILKKSIQSCTFMYKTFWKLIKNKIICNYYFRRILYSFVIVILCLSLLYLFNYYYFIFFMRKHILCMWEEGGNNFFFLIKCYNCNYYIVFNYSKLENAASTHEVRSLRWIRPFLLLRVDVAKLPI